MGWGYSRIVILAVLGDGCYKVAGGTVVHGCCGGRDDQFLGGSVGSEGMNSRGVEWIVNLFSLAEYPT